MIFFITSFKILQLTRHNETQTGTERICVKLKQPLSQKVQLQLASIMTFKIEKLSKLSLLRTCSIGKIFFGGGKINFTSK